MSPVLPLLRVVSLVSLACHWLVHWHGSPPDAARRDRLTAREADTGRRVDMEAGMIIGEGTNEIQHTIITRQLITCGGLGS